ncbi:MAG: beta-ketoacyl synthase chain length factor [Polyangiales bacterium]
MKVLGTGHVTSVEQLDLALLERTLRRGLSEVTKLFMHAAKLALDAAGTDARTMPVIFGSAFGEIAVAEALLAEAYDRDASSPARFRNSVHNTAPGLLSISQKNTAPCTAIAAGWDTVAMGLLEARAQLAEVERVLLVFAEERVPHTISDEHTHAQLGVAFVLAREGDGIALRNLRRQPLTRDPHPLAGALALARCIEQQREGTVSIGESWCIDVESAT